VHCTAYRWNTSVRIQKWKHRTWLVKDNTLTTLSAVCDMIWYVMKYLLSAIELTAGGSSTVHIYTQTIHRTTQNKLYIHIYMWNDTESLEECGPCPVFAGYTLAFALTTEEKARKTLSQGSWRVPVGTSLVSFTQRTAVNFICCAGVTWPHIFT
jgi:hypothetical protein